MKTVWVDGFAVTGREARTSNPREMSGKGVIFKMWSDVPSSSAIVAVYSEYESDKDGEYNYLLGTKAAPDDTPQRQVEMGEYILLQFEGPITAEATIGLWQQIWDLENTR